MKTIQLPSSFLLLIICNFSAFAQNWDYFKKDSLRVFYNPSQNNNQDQDLLSGIDFRTYVEKNDSIIFDLSAFSRTIAIEDKIVKRSREGYEYYVIGVYSGNSNFGSQIIVSKHVTSLIFKASSSYNNDTIVLLNTNEVGTKWISLSTERFSIECEVTSITKEKNDSIKSIRCKVTDRIAFEDKTFTLKISKSFGLMESPVFFDILFNKSSLIDKKEVRLMTYREMKKRDFFALTPGTEFHFRIENTYPSDSKTKGSRRLKYIKTVNDTQYFNLDEELARTKNNIVISSSTINEQTFVYLDHSDSIFNTIPSKRTSYSIPNETNNYYNECGKLVVTQFNRASYRALRGDTIISINHFINHLHKEYTENIGITSYDSQDFEKIHINEKWEYLNIPNECTIGKPNWRFTSVKNPNHSLNIYPNPASYLINISENIVVEKATMINSIGKIYSVQIADGQIDVSSMPDGFYIIELSDIYNKKYRNKVIILH